MPLPKTTAPLTRVCLSDVAYARLRDWILDGTLAPGEPLRDEALAEALGMSRTPIREALRRLEEEGLALSTATRRTQVSPVTLTQAREVYPIVTTLEALALRQALPLLAADPAALAATLDAMRTANARLAGALETGDAGEATAADEELHMAFVVRCGNDELIALLRDLRSKVRRIERVFWGAETDRTASVADHERLVAAVEAREGARAEGELARNWERGLSWINPATNTTTTNTTATNTTTTTTGTDATSSVD